MSEIAQKTIDIVSNVFKSENVEIPLCISVVLASEGFELYSTKTCKPSEMEAINVLGLIAFEELKTSVNSRTDEQINILIFRTGERECYVAPVSDDIFLVAASSPGTVGNVMPLLDGLSAQVKFELSKLQNMGE
ncbi:MAG: hypothetical protein ACW97P_05735 [Candidatus Hodarchaeales archaeon]|jgi:hypothetical protein